MLLTALIGSGTQAAAQGSGLEPERIARFERIVERLRIDLKVPGISAAIVKGQQLAWARGFGHADLERQIDAAPDTPYQLASVTKALASIVVLHLVETGQLDLNDPIDKHGAYTTEIPSSGTVRLVHLMTHTSDDPPGSAFRYDGNRYGGLGIAVKRVTGRSFRDLFFEQVARPLELTHTAPTPIDPEFMRRFLEYREAEGLQPIPDKQGQPVVLGDLYDPLGPHFWTAYLMAEQMVHDTFLNRGQELPLFWNRERPFVDPATQREFEQFWGAHDPFQEPYEQLARPYDLDADGQIVRGQYPSFFSPSAGMISSVEDLARFDIALDQGRLISEATRERAFTPFRSTAGEPLPYGLGWFTQQHEGVRLIWHGGEWTCVSALYLKVPDQDLTLIILANARAMSQAFVMEQPDVLHSGPGLAFLRLFVFEKLFGEDAPETDWTNPPEQILSELSEIADERLFALCLRELAVMETMYARMRRPELAGRLINEVHAVLNEDLWTGPEDDLPVLAEIAAVGNAEHRRVEFELRAEQTVAILCIGERAAGAWVDHGWIEDRASGKVVWQMSAVSGLPAGGASNYRQVDARTTLSAGEYALHFKTNESHAFLEWTLPPPDQIFWGIRITVAE